MTDNTLLQTMIAIEKYVKDKGHFPSLEDVGLYTEPPVSAQTARNRVIRLTELGLIRRSEKGKIIGMVPVPKDGKCECNCHKPSDQRDPEEYPCYCDHCS